MNVVKVAKETTPVAVAAKPAEKTTEKSVIETAKPRITPSKEESIAQEPVEVTIEDLKKAIAPCTF